MAGGVSPPITLYRIYVLALKERKNCSTSHTTRRHGWTPARLVQLCVWLQTLFRSPAARGRCEVRYEHGTLFLDFALLGSVVPSRVTEWIAQLRAHIVGSAATITFHPGKFVVPL